MDQRLKNFILHNLRKASYKWPARNEALKRAKVSTGLYKCAHCSVPFTRKDIALDHIDPVIPVDVGFTNFDTYIIRLFCPAEGFQVLCKVCHNTKTQAENAQRKIFKSAGVVIIEKGKKKRGTKKKTS